MKGLNKYSTLAILFFIFSICLFFVFLSPGFEAIKNEFVLFLGIDALILGGVIGTFHDRTRIDRESKKFFSAQENYQRWKNYVAAGVHNHSVFFPALTRSSIAMQFIPMSRPENLTAYHFSPYTHDNISGGLFIPPGYSLLNFLQKEFDFYLPEHPEEYVEALQEILEDALDLAPSVRIVHIKNTYQIHLKGYKYIDTCHDLLTQSPTSCLFCPCPLCSAIGMTIATTHATSCILHRVILDKKTASLSLFFKLSPPKSR